MLDKVKISLIDDHLNIHYAYEFVFKLHDKKLKCYFSGEDFLEHLSSGGQQPDVVILDFQIRNKMNGYDVAKKIIKQYPEIRIIMLTMHDSSCMVQHCVQAGALAFVNKSCSIDTMIDAINTVYGGDYYYNELLTPELVADCVSNNIEPTFKIDKPLTEKEKVILKYIVMGLTYLEIGKELGLSKRTIETHKTNIFIKTGISKASQLVKYAYDLGLY